jgi:spore coat protein A, manganese oxidase
VQLLGTAALRGTRRQFLALAAATGITSRIEAQAQQRPVLDPSALPKFVDALPVPPLLASDGTRPNPHDRKQLLPFYRLEMTELSAQLHRDIPPTRQWGYGGCVPGPTLATSSGRAFLVEWVNKLPKRHFLPIDHTLHGAERSKPAVRTVTHVHGAKVPPESDGYPEAWFTHGHSRIDYYPNNQEAATLWYHDHAMGITRLNIFAGLFGTLTISDPVERALNLPSGAFDIPLTLYDRTLDRDGQLLYPVSGSLGAPFVSEFHGNAILCNGKLFPYLDVQPRKYRFRMLNAANSSHFQLSLSGNQRFHQVASDQGLLAAPLEINTLLLFPAERADVVIDFAALEGQTLQLNAGELGILQFRVAKRPAAPETSALPATLRSVPRTPESQAVRDRFLTLAEHDNASGTAMMMLLNESHWDTPVTENPVLDSTEIWSFVNLGGDAHPIHLHLVRFQVLDRRPFDVPAYNADKSLVYTGPAVAPDPNELGWKDTVRADPGMITRIIVKFEGYVGRYVWHCHTLEHEDNEMMRPYDVIPR